MSRLITTYFDAIDVGVQNRSLEPSTKTVNAIHHKIYTLDVGKNVSVDLGGGNIAAATDPKLLFLKTDVEGVEWWPNDQAAGAASVDPGAAPFGWIFDNEAPVFGHGLHGANDLSGVSGNHGSYHEDVFPTWMHNLDGVNGDNVSLVSKLTDQDDERGYVGFGTTNRIALDFQQAAAANDSYRKAWYFWGPGAYKNFGTLTDGAFFWLVFRMEDKTKLAATPLELMLGSYPFSENRLDANDIPAETPGGGAVPFSSTDRNLCYSDLFDGLIKTCRFYTAAGDSPDALADGWAAYKSGALKMDNSTVETAGSPRFNGGDEPSMSRITWARLKATAAGAGAPLDADLQLANVFYGPAPGSRYRIRNHQNYTGQPWTVGNPPFITIQNPTTRPAHVEVLFGRL